MDELCNQDYIQQAAHFGTDAADEMFRGGTRQCKLNNSFDTAAASFKKKKKRRLGFKTVEVWI